jgi:hypothetical protein
MWESTYFFPLCTTKVDRYTSIIYMDIYADCSTCIAPPRSPFPEGIINYHSTNQSHVLWTWGFHKHACMDIQTTMGSTIRGMCVYYFLLYYLHYETVVIYSSEESHHRNTFMVVNSTILHRRQSSRN